MTELSSRQRDALENLIRVAHSDTGQSRRVADFLLAWWNAQEHGGFDLTDLWSVDAALAQDMTEVFKLVAASHSYPDALGYPKQFERIVALWRTTPAPDARPQA